MVKLIFLDLDGVLVTRFPGVFDPDLVRNLKTVVDATGAEIVLSSDWRRCPQAREDARRTLRSFGLDFIGYTPCLSPNLPQRPKEILQWKDEHHSNGGSFITQWIAIDDRSLLEEEKGACLGGHFLQTDVNIGFTEECVEEAIHLLNTESVSPRGNFLDGFSSPAYYDDGLPLRDALRNGIPLRVPVRDAMKNFEFDKRMDIFEDAFAEQGSFREAYEMPWTDPVLSMSQTDQAQQDMKKMWPLADWDKKRTDPSREAAANTFDAIMSYGPRASLKNYASTQRMASGRGWPHVGNRSEYDDQGKMMDLDRPRPDVSNMPRSKIMDLDRTRIDRPRPDVSNLPRGKMMMGPDRPSSASRPKVFDISTSMMPQKGPPTFNRHSTPSPTRASLSDVTPRPNLSPPKVIDIHTPSAPVMNRGQRPVSAPRSRCRVLDMESNMPERKRPSSPGPSRSNPRNKILELGRPERPKSAGRPERPKSSQVLDFVNVDAGIPGSAKKHGEQQSFKSPSNFFNNPKAESNSAKIVNMNPNHPGSRSNPTKYNQIQLDLGPNESEPSTPKRRSANHAFPVWDFR